MKVDCSFQKQISHDVSAGFAVKRICTLTVKIKNNLYFYTFQINITPVKYRFTEENLSSNERILI